MTKTSKLSVLASIRERIELIQSEVIEFSKTVEVDYDDCEAYSESEFFIADQLEELEALQKALSDCETTAAKLLSKETTFQTS